MGLFRSNNGNSDKFMELRDDGIAAYEESTGQLPNDYEVGVISAAAREMLDEKKDN